MKNLLFLLTLLICKVTVSQHVTQVELFSFKSIDKIPKKIQFTYSKNTQKSLIIIKGHNQKNSHRQSCSWESKLDIDGYDAAHKLTILSTLGFALWAELLQKVVVVPIGPTTF